MSEPTGLEAIITAEPLARRQREADAPETYLVLLRNPRLARAVGTALEEMLAAEDRDALALVPPVRGTGFAQWVASPAPADRQRLRAWCAGNLPAGGAPVLVGLDEDGLADWLRRLRLAAYIGIPPGQGEPAGLLLGGRAGEQLNQSSRVRLIPVTTLSDLIEAVAAATAPLSPAAQGQEAWAADPAAASPARPGSRRLRIALPTSRGLAWTGSALGPVYWPGRLAAAGTAGVASLALITAGLPSSAAAAAARPPRPAESALMAAVMRLAAEGIIIEPPASRPDRRHPPAGQEHSPAGDEHHRPGHHRPRHHPAPPAGHHQPGHHPAPPPGHHPAPPPGHHQPPAPTRPPAGSHSATAQPPASPGQHGHPAVPGTPPAGPHLPPGAPPPQGGPSGPHGGGQSGPHGGLQSPGANWLLSWLAHNYPAIFQQAGVMGLGVAAGYGFGQLAKKQDHGPLKFLGTHPGTMGTAIVAGNAGGVAGGALGRVVANLIGTHQLGWQASYLNPANGNAVMGLVNSNAAGAWFLEFGKSSAKPLGHGLDRAEGKYGNGRLIRAARAVVHPDRFPFVVENIASLLVRNYTKDIPAPATIVLGASLAGRWTWMVLPPATQQAAKGAGRGAVYELGELGRPFHAVSFASSALNAPGLPSTAQSFINRIGRLYAPLANAENHLATQAAVISLDTAAEKAAADRAYQLAAQASHQARRASEPDARRQARASAQQYLQEAGQHSQQAALLTQAGYRAGLALQNFQRQLYHAAALGPQVAAEKAAAASAYRAAAQASHRARLTSNPDARWQARANARRHIQEAEQHSQQAHHLNAEIVRAATNARQALGGFEHWLNSGLGSVAAAHAQAFAHTIDHWYGPAAAAAVHALDIATSIAGEKDAVAQAKQAATREGGRAASLTTQAMAMKQRAWQTGRNRAEANARANALLTEAAKASENNLRHLREMQEHNNRARSLESQLGSAEAAAAKAARDFEHRLGDELGLTPLGDANYAINFTDPAQVPDSAPAAGSSAQQAAAPPSDSSGSHGGSLPSASAAPAKTWPSGTVVAMPGVIPIHLPLIHGAPWDAMIPAEPAIPSVPGHPFTPATPAEPGAPGAPVTPAAPTAP
ncbi:MAG: hypothetical protein ACLQDY_13405, partial [Streptosporangiaceae bacterium]